MSTPLILENDQLKVQSKAEGAELTSLFHKAHALEYLWQADPSIWARHAPVLFPIVGKLKNNQYTYKGKAYSLPQHGLARDQRFEVVESSAEKISFLLRNTEQILKVYPFPFELTISYSLQGVRLRTHYVVKNVGEEEMLFSIGAHPAFRCPLMEEEAYEDYYLEFDQNEQQQTPLLEQGYRGNTFTPSLQGRLLPLTQALFKNDALIYTGLNSHKISLRSKNHSHGIHFRFEGYPYMGIWSKPGPFVCLEPWHGIADHISHEGDLEKKEGILRLAQGQSFECHFDIDLF